MLTLTLQDVNNSINPTFSASKYNITLNEYVEAQLELIEYHSQDTT